MNPITRWGASISVPDPVDEYEEVGWVSVSQGKFFPVDDLPAGRFVVYRKVPR